MLTRCFLERSLYFTLFPAELGVPILHGGCGPCRIRAGRRLGRGSSLALELSLVEATLPDGRVDLSACLTATFHALPASTRVLRGLRPRRGVRVTWRNCRHLVRGRFLPVASAAIAPTIPTPVLCICGRRLRPLWGSAWHRKHWGRDPACPVHGQQFKRFLCQVCSRPSSLSWALHACVPGCRPPPSRWQSQTVTQAAPGSWRSPPSPWG